MKCLKLATWMLSVSLTALLLGSCSTKIEEYKDPKPALNIESYFDGPVIAWGMIQDYNDKLTRRFCVELVGTWSDNNGVLNGELKETFYFDDGEITYRNWQLVRTSNNQFTGTAEDVIGVAKGNQNGFAFQWQYQLSVDIDDKNYHFTLDDWMYQIDQYRVFNKTEMKKFGIKVADITLFFDKQQPLRQCEMEYYSDLNKAS